MTINFGKIAGRRVVTFKVSNDGLVIPAKHRRQFELGAKISCLDFITAHESFRRWKIARKAWKIRRRKRNQLTLAL